MNLSAVQVTAIIPAAGRGHRAGGGENKLLLPLAGCPLLVHTLRAFENCGAVGVVVVVVHPEDQKRLSAWPQTYRLGKIRRFVTGGPKRQDSVRCGLESMDWECEVVVVHDGARPLVRPELIARTVEVAAREGSAVAAVPVTDTIKWSEDGRQVERTLDREKLWAVQTPQTFQHALLRAAHAQAAADGYQGTDEAALVEHLGQPVVLVPGDRSNLKITTAEDFAIATTFLQSSAQPWDIHKLDRSISRVGAGYDLHRFVPGRELWLGGVLIPHNQGLLGHSDADALLHAICDALLGALGAGDIGHHFPDTDPAFQGIPSVVLLERVGRWVVDRGYAIGNLDATVLAEQPRLAPYLEAMRVRIAAALCCSPDQVNIKATTCEGLGAIGAGEGLAAQALVSLVRMSEV